MKVKFLKLNMAKLANLHYRVEAKLNGDYKQLQPGMEGIGKIYVGDRNLAWIITHKVMDRIRLSLWYLWP